MADAPLNCVVFGAGALGLGFLGPELSGDCRVAYVDVTEKADLTRALARAQSYSVNMTGLSMHSVRVSGVTAMFKERGSVTDEVLDALSGGHRLVVHLQLHFSSIGFLPPGNFQLSGDADVAPQGAYLILLFRVVLGDFQ